MTLKLAPASVAAEARGAARGRTPRRAHDPLTRLLLDDAEHAVLLLGATRRIADMNGAACALLGVPVSRAKGRPAAELLRGVVLGDDPVDEGYRRQRTEVETVLLNAHGAEVPVALRTYRLADPVRLLVTLRDLTQARRIHEESRRNERMAVLGQLATGVAHEIRNPLAGIGTSAQVLLRRFEPRDDRARFVQVILEEVERLDRIVTSLLQYSRPRTPELRPVDLGPLVGHVHELLAEQLAAAGVEATREIAPRMPSLFVDPDLVTQVLLNVSVNAIQAMPRGGTLRWDVRRVRRRAAPRGPGRRQDDRGGPERRRAGAPWREYQQVRVTDTGVGMPRGVLAKLFHPFFTTKSGGTGLGLAICQTIMQEHGGVIEVASREGRGTTVMLNFPVEKRNGERRDAGGDAGGPDAAHRR